jgi:CRISPR/Cas system-associated protein Cas7 (RAMP superfamily)
VITTHLFLFFSGFSSGEAEEEVPVRRTGAGRSRKRRRYELPNGMHVYGTAEEAQALAEEFINREARTVVVEKKKKKLVIPEVHIVLDDGEQPYIRLTKQKEPDATDAFVAFTQKADLDAIAFENIINQLRRRRRIKALLLAS